MKEFGQALLAGIIFWFSLTPLILYAIDNSPLFK
jgi:hypothetical protein